MKDTYVTSENATCLIAQGYFGEIFQGYRNVIHQVVFCRFKLQADEGYIRHYLEYYTTNCAGLLLVVVT